MLSNYPIKPKNQHEQLEFAYNEYIDIPDEAFVNNISADRTATVYIEMSRNVHDMRRDFKRTVKKLKHLYIDKKPKFTMYKQEKTKFPKITLPKERLVKRHAI